MRITRMWATAATLAATLSLAACAADGPTAPDLATLNATAVGQQQSQVADVMSGAVFQSLFANVSSSVPVFSTHGRSPVNAMLSRTAAMLATHTAAHSSISQQRAVVAALTAQTASWIPTTLFGKTFVLQNGTYVWDDTRTDAPANGVRIVLYQRAADGSLGTTAIGLLDVVDNSTASTTGGTATIYDGSGAVLGTLTNETTQGTSGALGTVTGTLGIAPQQLVIADTVSAGIDGSGNISVGLSTHTTATFANVGLHAFIPNFGLDATSLAMTVEVTAGEHIVRIEAVESSNSTAASGKVFVDDYLVGNLNAGSSPEITDPSGGPVAPELLEYFGAVATLASHIPVGIDLWANMQSFVDTLSVLT